MKKVLSELLRCTKNTILIPTDKNKKFVAIDVKTLKKLKYPVTLDRIKKNNKLRNVPLIKQSRLSVMPLTIDEFKEILKLSNKNG